MYPRPEPQSSVIASGPLCTAVHIITIRHSVAANTTHMITYIFLFYQSVFYWRTNHICREAAG